MAGWLAGWHTGTSLVRNGKLSTPKWAEPSRNVGYSIVVMLTWRHADCHTLQGSKILSDPRKNGAVDGRAEAGVYYVGTYGGRCRYGVFRTYRIVTPPLVGEAAAEEKQKDLDA